MRRLFAELGAFTEWTEDARDDWDAVVGRLKSLWAPQIREAPRRSSTRDAPPRALGGPDDAAADGVDAGGAGAAAGADGVGVPRLCADDIFLAAPSPQAGAEEAEDDEEEAEAEAGGGEEEAAEAADDEAAGEAAGDGGGGGDDDGAGDGAPAAAESAEAEEAEEAAATEEAAEAEAAAAEAAAAGGGAGGGVVGCRRRTARRVGVGRVPDPDGGGRPDGADAADPRASPPPVRSARRVPWRVGAQRLRALTSIVLAPHMVEDHRGRAYLAALKAARAALPPPTLLPTGCPSIARPTAARAAAHTLCGSRRCDRTRAGVRAPPLPPLRTRRVQRVLGQPRVPPQVWDHRRCARLRSLPSRP